MSVQHEVLEQLVQKFTDIALIPPDFTDTLQIYYDDIASNDSLRKIALEKCKSVINEWRYGREVDKEIIRRCLSLYDCIIKKQDGKKTDDRNEILKYAGKNLKNSRSQHGTAKGYVGNGKNMDSNIVSRGVSIQGESAARISHAGSNRELENLIIQDIEVSEYADKNDLHKERSMILNGDNTETENLENLIIEETEVNNHVTEGTYGEPRLEFDMDGKFIPDPMGNLILEKLEIGDILSLEDCYEQKLEFNKYGHEIIQREKKNGSSVDEDEKKENPDGTKIPNEGINQTNPKRRKKRKLEVNIHDNHQENTRKQPALSKKACYSSQVSRLKVDNF